MLFLPAFGAKARARDTAIAELRPLLAMEKLPANFWDQPYAVGFIMGYVDAVTHLVAGDKTSIELVSDVTTRAMHALAPDEMEMIPKRLGRWTKPPEPKFAEGRKNGSFIAMFMHGDRNADATELAIEAFKQARARAPVFDQMKEQTNERGRAAMILCDVLFFDKIFKEGMDPAMRAAWASADIIVQEQKRMSGDSTSADGLFLKVRAELKSGGGELGARTIAALEAERNNDSMNQILEAEIFAKLHSDDRKALGEELAIKHIVEANVHASIVFKYHTKKITEEQMRAEIEAAHGKFTKHDIPEAEIFAKSIGELEAERGEITTKEIIEAKIFAKCFARAIAKVNDEQDADTTSRKSPTYRIAAIDPHELPPSHGTIWLDGNEVWFSTPSKDFSFDGRPYHIPGGATCFPREKIGRQVLLKILRTQRDLWDPGDKEALKARLIEWAEKSQG